MDLHSENWWVWLASGMFVAVAAVVVDGSIDFGGYFGRNLLFAKSGVIPNDHCFDANSGDLGVKNTFIIT